MPPVPDLKCKGTSSRVGNKIGDEKRPHEATTLTVDCEPVVYPDKPKKERCHGKNLRLNVGNRKVRGRR